MKIVRAPLRVSLFGGGTDLDPFCAQHGSTIISFAINRYIYLTWNDRPTGGCRLSYSEVEELESLKDAKHTLVRETSLDHGIKEPCTLTIVSDLPKGTGLGSSSALSVALVHLVYPTHLDIGRPDNLVREAARIEKTVSRAGFQDHFPAAYGGFNIYRFRGFDSPSGFKDFGACSVSSHLIDLINTHGLLLYTGLSRKADDVLGSWQKSEDDLHEIKALADDVASRINEFRSAETLGSYLDKTWQLKRRIASVTNPTLNRQYAQAIMAGALGGKLCGAGAGGCWFFLVRPENRERVVQALGLREIPFQIAEKGVESWEL